MAEPENTEPNPEQGYTDTHLGHRLYWQRNQVGGRVYHSDEIPTGVFVWDTALVAYGTLCEAIAVEFGLQAAALRAERRARFTALEASAQFDATDLDYLAEVTQPERPPAPQIYSSRQLVELLKEARAHLQGVKYAEPVIARITAAIGQ